MKDTDQEKFAKEILRNSYTELDNPEFGASTMRRVLRASRRQRIMDNILLNVLIFGAIDALIWVAVRMTGLSVTGLVNRSVSGLNAMFARAGELEQTVMANNLTVYLVLSVGAIAAALAIIELQLNSRKGIGR